MSIPVDTSQAALPEPIVGEYKEFTDLGPIELPFHNTPYPMIKNSLNELFTHVQFLEKMVAKLTRQDKQKVRNIQLQHSRLLIQANNVAMEGAMSVTLIKRSLEQLKRANDSIERIQQDMHNSTERDRQRLAGMLEQAEQQYDMFANDVAMHFDNFNMQRANVLLQTCRGIMKDCDELKTSLITDPSYKKMKRTGALIASTGGLAAALVLTATLPFLAIPVEAAIGLGVTASATGATPLGVVLLKILFNNKLLRTVKRLRKQVDTVNANTGEVHTAVYKVTMDGNYISGNSTQPVATRTPFELQTFLRRLNLAID
eukprot:CAMPEP_0168587736 /NCGR_PEP_ID=MMETSP0420-20121227/5046_1 /TAXON_ID=498008 /ORGANISM="Pessonella sp." /LENGTH=314 /DNA_ID=CAMNT_0008623053 /DNA_START=1 /DNA_END=942 /DNA_ORIENTATION=+